MIYGFEELNAPEQYYLRWYNFLDEITLLSEQEMYSFMLRKAIRYSYHREKVSRKQDQIRSDCLMCRKHAL